MFTYFRNLGYDDHAWFHAVLCLLYLKPLVSKKLLGGLVLRLSSLYFDTDLYFPLLVVKNWFLYFTRGTKIKLYDVIFHVSMLHGQNKSTLRGRVVPIFEIFPTNTKVDNKLFLIFSNGAKIKLHDDIYRF